MRIAICEDEKNHADILTDMVKRWARDERVAVDMGHYKSAEDFLFHWASDGPFELAFLDIQMSQMDGMQLAQYIREKDRTMLLVFTTGNRDLVFRGYDVQAFHYLPKPIKEEDCRATLKRAVKALALRQTDALIIPTGDGLMRLALNEVFYFEVNNHAIFAHAQGGNFQYKEKLSAIERQVREPQFCKCHRSYIVNLHFVKQIHRDHAILDNDERIPVSRACWAALNKCFLNYYRGPSHEV